MKGRKLNSSRRTTNLNLNISTRYIPSIMRPRTIKNSIGPTRLNNRHLISIPTHAKTKYSFPKLFLSNTRSMVNKLDEIHGTISINSCDVTVITETWLTSNVTDNLISIPGFVHMSGEIALVINVVVGYVLFHPFHLF